MYLLFRIIGHTPFSFIKRLGRIIHYMLWEEIPTLVTISKTKKEFFMTILGFMFDCVILLSYFGLSILCYKFSSISALIFTFLLTFSLFFLIKVFLGQKKWLLFERFLILNHSMTYNFALIFEPLLNGLSKVHMEKNVLYETTYCCLYMTLRDCFCRKDILNYYFSRTSNIHDPSDDDDDVKLYRTFFFGKYDSYKLSILSEHLTCFVIIHFLITSGVTEKDSYFTDFKILYINCSKEFPTICKFSDSFYLPGNRQEIIQTMINHIQYL